MSTAKNGSSMRPASPPTGPRETGTRYATLARPPAEDLHVFAADYQGHPYVGVRIWTLGRDGAWYPTQRGLTVRRGEVREFLAGLVAGDRHRNR